MSVIDRSPRECPLTQAELRVLELLMQGLSYEEIATRLRRKPSTIRSQLNSAYHRLGVKASYQAVLECVRAGWLVWSDERPEAVLRLRTQRLLRELVDAIVTNHERDQLSDIQQEYLRCLDSYLYARDDLERHLLRGRMNQSLRSMLVEAQVTMDAGIAPTELIADVAAVVDESAPVLA